jgi:hypothetical protein
MTTEDFVRGFRQQKDEMLQMYFADTSDASVVSVGTHIRSMRLSVEQSETMRKLLDQALTDAFYSMLLAFDGCARIGSLQQQSFQIQSEDGSLVCRGDGEVEGLAYEYFHTQNVA